MRVFTDNPDDPAVVDPWDTGAWAFSGVLFLVGGIGAVVSAQSFAGLVGQLIGALLGAFVVGIGLWNLGSALRSHD